MLVDALYIALIVAVTFELASNGYVLLAIWHVRRFRRQADHRGAGGPPVTVLVPICGADAGLYRNLRTLCCQDYRDYQLVLGVRDPADPAIAIVERIIRDFPERDIALVVEARVVGANLKISNLINMYTRAKHPVLVIVDSDMRVSPDYLSTIVSPLEDPGVGAVTCLYKGTPAGGLPSVLGSMFINEWFLPSVLVAASLQKFTFCFGATMAVRRDLFERVGGFARLGDYLADDYMLGKLVSDQGYRVHLSSYVVENVIADQSFKALFLRELRWARTIRAVQPFGYALSFVMYSIPLAILAGFLDDVTLDTDFFEFGFVLFAIALRLALHFIARNVLEVRRGPAPWLVPVRDLLSFLVWVIGLLGRGVVWRGRAFSVDSEGFLVAKG